MRLSAAVGRWWIVGLAFHGIGLALLWVFTQVLRVPLAVGTIVSAEITLLVRFLVNDRWVFGNARPTWARLWKFHAAAAGGTAIWWVVTNGLARAGVNYLIAANAGTACSVLFSMASNFLWVWRGRESKKEHAETGDAEMPVLPSADPVSHPDWASPLKVGLHARSLFSALPEQPTREVLQALKSDPRLVDILEGHGLGRLELSGRVPKPHWLGYYDPRTGDLVVNTLRPESTFGREFGSPELPSVSAAAPNLVEALQRSLYHEIGHHLLERVPAAVLDQFVDLRRSRKLIPVSRRARDGILEYFSETYTAYRFEDSLADRDPAGYDMIEAVLRLLWNR